MTIIEHRPQISLTAFRSPGFAAVPPIKFRATNGNDEPDWPEEKWTTGSIREISRHFLRHEIRSHFVAELLAFAVLAGCSAVSVPSIVGALQHLMP